ncbi:MAG: hypothetical protein ACOC1P_03800 [Minisyncoccales bacterium]
MSELNITQQTENKFFERNEIEGKITAKEAPSYKEMRKILSEKFSVPVDRIKVNLIQGRFGSHEFTIKANIYSSKEALEKTEKKSKKELAAEKAEAEEAEQEKQAQEQPQEPESDKTATDTETETQEETKPEESAENTDTQAETEETKTE